MDLRKPMTDLLEFCRKINCGRLEFNYSKGEESSFNCKVTLLDMEANGSGGSKDDAREVAAFNLLRKLDELPECGDLVKIEDKAMICRPRFLKWLKKAEIQMLPNSWHAVHWHQLNVMAFQIRKRKHTSGRLLQF
ncbi:uncharacterized protein LOC111518709 isoform X4 [Drosophila willistoni]|uniref:uncharacterized protein LOC111518709 isoform X4 n=1 Tax=Drosophila willistoni TaxID=7260 RepID=UPI001F0784DB|nr:uncharacterized protein LOC111518709 isoform X4 [Drosophila willistoni]